jgi:hypothetical protein
MTKPSRRSQLLQQLRSINPKYTGGKSIASILSVPSTAALNSIEYLESAIEFLGFKPVLIEKKAKGWPKGKFAQEEVIQYCESLPPGEHTVSMIVAATGKSRGTVIAALGLQRSPLAYKRNPESDRHL